MKRAIVIIVAITSMTALGFGQAKATAPATPAATTGKRPPQAKTQPEFAAFNAAKAVTDAAAQEKAVDDFASKFPDSELRPYLYKSVMQAYQQANNSEKMLAMAQKVLSYDADDPEALLASAQVLAERTKETDADKDQKLAEARKDAERAMVTVDTDIPTAAYPPDKLADFKAYVRSEAYAIVGTIDFNAKAYPAAEGNLRKSIDAMPQQPDPVAVFRLSVALDMQNKYPEAMKYADQAVELTKEGTSAGDAARTEKKRLVQLVGGIQ